MADLFDDPELLQLLRDADNARTLLERPNTPHAEDLQLALDSIHADIGRLVHARFEAQHGALGEQPTLSDPFEDETEILEPSPWDAVTEAIPAAELKRRIEEMAAAVEQGPVTLDDLEPVEDDSAWRETVDALVRLLPRPGDPVALQAAQLQWASMGMADHLRELPDAQAYAVIAMLAATARQIEEVLSLSVGPRRALARLKEVRPGITLAAFDPQAAPERESWADDAAHWRAALQVTP